MNQNVIFNEMPIIDWHQGWLEFDGMQMGHKIRCLIRIKELENRLDQTFSTEEEVLASFEQLKFELEEEAEQLINDENYDAQGRIWLGTQAQ